MTIKEQISKYLPGRHMMQLATALDNKPWSCTVTYVSDENLNIYWASLPSRRHSQELMQNSSVSAAIPVNFAKGQKVVGIQVQGKASQLQDKESILPIAVLYANKFGGSKSWTEKISEGKTGHRIYVLQPELFVLFDEVNFPDNPRKEYKVA